MPCILSQLRLQVSNARSTLRKHRNCTYQAGIEMFSILTFVSRSSLVKILLKKEKYLDYCPLLKIAALRIKQGNPFSFSIITNISVA